MGTTSIEWTDHSVNPIKFQLALATGPVLVNMCTLCSAGCKNCYADTITGRFWPKEAGPYPGYTADALKMGEFVIDDRKLQEVLRRRKPTKYFWCDMTDMFHPSVPFDLVDRCFAVMALTPQHTHQILTKRPERMAEYFTRDGGAVYAIARDMVDSGCGPDVRKCWENKPRYLGKRAIDGVVFESRSSWDAAYSARQAWNDNDGPRPLPNVWIGTSVENQAASDERIPDLLRCPAAVRFLSVEPLLGPVDLKHGVGVMEYVDGSTKPAVFNYLTCVPGIDWVIVGGESGRGSRPCNIEWIRSIIGQCKAAGVPCFVKQLGADPTYFDDGSGAGGMIHEFRLQSPDYQEIKDRKGGDWSEWPEDLRVREFPEDRR